MRSISSCVVAGCSLVASTTLHSIMHCCKLHETRTVTSKQLYHAVCELVACFHMLLSTQGLLVLLLVLYSICQHPHFAATRAAIMHAAQLSGTSHMHEHSDHYFYSFQVCQNATCYAHTQPAPHIAWEASLNGDLCSTPQHPHSLAKVTAADMHWAE